MRFYFNTQIIFPVFKKKNTADTSRLPRFENYGQSPESFSNFEISANGHAEKPPQTIAAPQNEGFRQEYKVLWQDTPAPPQPVGARQEIADATNQAMKTQHGQPEENPVVAPDDVFSTLLKKNYQEREESLKRQRASEFWGNLAKLFGQTVSSALGARIFSPIQDNTAEYNQAIDRLRNSYNDTLYCSAQPEPEDTCVRRIRITVISASSSNRCRIQWVKTGAESGKPYKMLI